MLCKPTRKLKQLRRFMMLRLKVLRQYPLSRIAVLVFLLILVGVGAIPGYLTGRWSWASLPPVTTLPQLRSLHEKGLTLPGWQSNLYRDVQIGGHRWLVQQILRDRQVVAILLLLPQNGPKDKPQVEWMDINGFHRWQTDSDRILRFTINTTTVTNKQTAIAVEAQFFRGWNQQQTFAVLEWYAWPKGGSPVPIHWFWQDRIAQLSRHRVPWVAVSLLLPIEPLGDIEPSRPLATTLGQTIQTSLISSALSLQN